MAKELTPLANEFVLFLTRVLGESRSPFHSSCDVERIELADDERREIVLALGHVRRARGPHVDMFLRAAVFGLARAINTVGRAACSPSPN